MWWTRMGRRHKVKEIDERKMMRLRLGCVMRWCRTEYSILSLLIDVKRTDQLIKTLVLGCVAATATAGGWIDEWLDGWEIRRKEE